MLEITAMEVIRVLTTDPIAMFSTLLGAVVGLAWWSILT